MEFYKIVLVLLSLVVTISLDKEDEFFRMTSNKKINKYSITKYVLGISTLIYCIFWL